MGDAILPSTDVTGVADALIVGGYGTFGSLIARDLAAAGIRVTVAGRDGERAERLAASLPGARAAAADVRDPRALRAVLAGHAVAVLAAGPFDVTGAPFLEAVLDLGLHAVDLAEDRAHLSRVRAAGERLAARGIAYVAGASSLPALSLALAESLGGGPAESARVTLFIGNGNRKGRAAVATAVAVAGRAIAAPQGTLVGFRGRARVEFPPPIGRRTARLFDAPEYDLFAERLFARSVEVRVAFEHDVAGIALGALGRTPRALRPAAAAALRVIGPLLPRLGTTRGAVRVEIVGRDGRSRRGAIVARADGQRLAALPAVLATRALLLLERGLDAPRGALLAPDLLGADAILAGVRAAGFDVSFD